MQCTGSLGQEDSVSSGRTPQTSPDQPILPAACTTPALQPMVYVKSARMPVSTGEATHSSVQPPPGAHTVLAVSDA